MNRPEAVVAEMCHGISLCEPDLLWDQHYNIISRKHLNSQKVSLISGGGSGHEPAHAGFVGHGMLDAAVCGDIFASPSQIQVYHAIRNTKSNKGTLLIIKNYSGDIMNFKNAAYLAQEDGIQVDYVKVDDDIAVQDSLYTVGRRGVAGTIFVHKIAGAAAERGYDLQRVKEIAQRVVSNVKTIGFAENSCTVPAKGTPTFELSETEMEYGVGIHGEPGIRREATMDADSLGRRMVEQLLDTLELSQQSQEEIALMINGLGATPLQELYLLNHSVRQALAAQAPSLSVAYTLTGNYMTSLDMAGASVTILKLDPELKELLFDPCSTPALKISGAVPAIPYEDIRKEEDPAQAEFQQIGTPSEWAVIQDERLTLQNIIYLVDAMSACIIQNEVAFCELDSHAGDGDFGMSVAKGFRKLKQNWNSMVSSSKSISEFLQACSMIIMEYCGGASGPIWGSAFRAAARSCTGQDSLNTEQVAQMLEQTVKGIQTTGDRSFGRGAVVGDKTLMDALIPCAQTWSDHAASGIPMVQLFRMGAQAAVAGAEYTKEIVARMGRAGTVGKRSLGYPDAGAYALGVIFTHLSEKIK